MCAPVPRRWARRRGSVVAPARGAGCRSPLRASPGLREGRTRGGGPGPLRGRTCSCCRWVAAATASRAATSTLLQHLRAPPPPRSPRRPKPPPPGGQFNPAEPRPPTREPPSPLPPPGPRAASPVRSEEVEESQRVSPKSRNPASKGARPPALPPPLLPSAFKVLV